MILYPNCKINVGLRVVRKRQDGYHDLETIFYPVYGLHDELEVTPSDAASYPNGYSLQQEGIVVDCPEDKNLIIKCLRMFREEFGDRIGCVDIRFRKNVPFGAGLGGGSSDAAHMAIALNELFQLGLSREDLARRVARLGADCAFFIYNRPCFAEGIGDILSPIDFDLTGLRLVMIKPEVGVSTREAYAGIVIKSDAKGMLNSVNSAAFRNGVYGELTNDFEATVFAAHRELADIKKRLLDAGAIYAAMSGSGSTIFGLFKDDTECSSTSRLGGLDAEFAPMIIFNDTL